MSADFIKHEVMEQWQKLFAKLNDDVEARVKSIAQKITAAAPFIGISNVKASSIPYFEIKGFVFGEKTDLKNLMRFTLEINMDVSMGSVKQPLRVPANEHTILFTHFKEDLSDIRCTRRHSQAADGECNLFDSVSSDLANKMTVELARRFAFVMEERIDKMIETLDFPIVEFVNGIQEIKWSVPPRHHQDEDEYKTTLRDLMARVWGLWCPTELKHEEYFESINAQCLEESRSFLMDELRLVAAKVIRNLIKQHCSMGKEIYHLDKVANSMLKTFGMLIDIYIDVKGIVLDFTPIGMQEILYFSGNNGKYKRTNSNNFIAKRHNLSKTLTN